ncbi:FAD-dependent oxidoreductase [soil metagenome]
MADFPEVLKTEVLVIGAGVLGLCTAVELTRRGHDVRVVDPGGANASSVAAGMIAPALEAVLDDVTPARAALFRDARIAWNGFASASGVDIHPAPTIWAGEGAAEVADALGALGFEAAEGADGRISLPSDGMVEPGPALAAMRTALRHPVVAGQVERVERRGGGWAISTGAAQMFVDAIVLATGAAVGIAGLPDAVATLVDQVTPIRGQIGWAGSLAIDAVTRGEGVYVAPSGAGAVIGASMEAGRRDLEPDHEVGERLKLAAERLLGRTVEGPIDWRVGIRGATPDGLPMAGPSGEADLYLALAPRRNGWLLGPLVARVVADAIESGNPNGGAGSPHATALDPRRFAIR